MSQFFILRPVFAWVIAIFIMLAGIVAIPRLPVARFPDIAPPSVSIFTTYAGADAQTVSNSVVRPIEKELSSVKNVLYYESSIDSTGGASITVTFKPGTDPEMAQVEVQNRLKNAEALLPAPVRREGLGVEAAESGFLMVITLRSLSGATDELSLGDYLSRNLAEELKRVPGVGRVQQFGSERAMRVWVDPAKLSAYGLSMADVTGAIARENAQATPGRVGDEPTVPGTRVSTPLTIRGQLTTPEAFAGITLRANTDGARLVLGDVARLELGAQTMAFSVSSNGKGAAAAAIQMSPGANAVSTSAAIEKRLAELRLAMPEDMEVSISYNTAPFVKVSITKVIHTLIEAMVLVFLVILLFLQKVRYTLIPTIVAPVALLGTFAVMALAGYSINVLTMFGMVLAIGIIVDDAIVVVENVERIMARQGLSPRAATQQAMREISGAIIGITLVLSAVFIPMGLAGGSVGAIYRQFTLSMAVSILFSAFLALTLTPALCATLLRPVTGHGEARGFFGRFNRGFDRMTRRYTGWVGWTLRRGGRMLVLYAVLIGVMAAGYMRLPTSFVPDEDQGSFMAMFELPAGATAERTRAVIAAYEAHTATRPDITENTVILGFGFSGSGPNAAQAFTSMKDWSVRKTSVDEEIAAAEAAMADIPEGMAMIMKPPAIESLGTTSGFSLRLEDRANAGPAALKAAEDRLIALAQASPLLSGVMSEGLPDGMSIALKIDREKAQALGLRFDTISETIGTAIGSTYVNDFPNQGRMQQVIVQADAPARMHVEDVLRLEMRNLEGGMVPLSEVATPVWESTALQLDRYNGYPAAQISGEAASGVSSGAAMDEMERLAGALPQGFAVEWSGQSLQERQSASQAPMLLAASMLVVFLVLAALYESWSVPFAVMLVVPLGLLGAVTAVLLRGADNDVFFKVGLVTIIGLSAKNAILMVEYARHLRAGGMGLNRAILQAARLRLRPILMTSMAFILGVVPLMLAQGAASEIQNAIGTGVFGGMVSATMLAVFFVPVLYVTVSRLTRGLAREKLRKTAP
ncbi:multidrug efflux RND transporter permease subunit [Rhodovulum sulfidophilum]|uniref:multidrug efflux RND transporter permease subunit n=1 Tax=Rhodovulum sulfidophilum TaxID=35806 RepID=UPI001921C05F|nr:multidrug efflux RND transporter permease subunit [Rhodovulum sulfidophilum]MBL3576100.1 multidrug efflux RND transporter permease subunit [Rhodovulum sulfidophilum]MCE8433317.1 multidrug efflux RND transporter permease subunit [Rhodovulum sulfidophilum]MCF4116924.1 multidrug efflux RND transporter permease subunit [Rhodovulum sulfidophilum]